MTEHEEKKKKDHVSS